MINESKTAEAHPNIALIKYWGNEDTALRLPANDSLSITLGDLWVRTSVEFDASLERDQLTINEEDIHDDRLSRVASHLDIVRQKATSNLPAKVQSSSNFPPGVGIASSAAGFAALSLAASAALDLTLDPRELSRLARRGSGSASRSVFGGFVEWHSGTDDESSFAEQIFPESHWALADAIAVISREHKAVGSTAGHALAQSSPIQIVRAETAPERISECVEALQEKDFSRLAAIVELDSNLMHSVMMTSSPPLLYWRAETVRVMKAVSAWRSGGLPVCYTIDAGPNVHCLCPAEHLADVEQRIRDLAGIESVITSNIGGPARLV